VKPLGNDAFGVVLILAGLTFVAIGIAFLRKDRPSPGGSWGIISDVHISNNVVPKRDEPPGLFQSHPARTPEEIQAAVDTVRSWGGGAIWIAGHVERRGDRD
jgi:hypothetical protein